MQRKPLLGILGGMGTYSGLYFQNLFFEVCTKNGISKDNEYPEWIYLNASRAPDRTEAICNEGESPIKYLRSMVRKFELSDVDIFVVTCNTAYHFLEEISHTINIPYINLQNETAIAAERLGIKSVMLLSTEGTLQSGLYRKAFKNIDIDYSEPILDSEMQMKITSAIYDPEFGIKATGSNISDKSKDLMHNVINNCEADLVIAGCTELSLGFSSMDISINWIDPLKVAAESLFDFWIGKRTIKSLR